MAGDETLLQLAGPPSGTCFHKGRIVAASKPKAVPEASTTTARPAVDGGREHGVAERDGREESQRRGDVVPGTLPECPASNFHCGQSSAAGVPLLAAIKSPTPTKIQRLTTLSASCCISPAFAFYAS